MKNALSNFTKQSIAFLSICSLGLWTGCHSSCENTQISGPYFISAGDMCENMAILFNEKEDYSGGAWIVFPTVFEIEWNDNFIVAKQHPRDLKEALTNAYYDQFCDSLKSAGSKNWWIADSLAKNKYQLNRTAGTFDNIFAKGNSENTFYYVIDVKKGELYPTILFSVQELDAVKDKLKIGKLEHRKYYDYLDKK